MYGNLPCIGGRCWAGGGWGGGCWPSVSVAVPAPSTRPVVNAMVGSQILFMRVLPGVRRGPPLMQGWTYGRRVYLQGNALRHRVTTPRPRSVASTDRRRMG